VEKTRSTSGGLRYLLAAAFFFSVMSVIVKVAGQRLPIAEIVFARSVVMLAIAYVLVRRAGVPLWGNRKPLLILRGLSGFAALFCFFYAITKLPLADITVLHFTNPAFTAILAMIFLKESMRPLEVLGLIVCLAGVILVTQPDFIFGENARSLNLFAVSVALAGSLLSSIAYTTVRKLGESDHHLVVIFYFPLVSIPVVLPLMAGRMLWPTMVEWGLLLGVGIVTLIAQVFLTKGLHRERAGRAMSMSYVQVIFAGVWGILFFNESPNSIAIAGALLTFGGTLLVARRS